MRRHSQPASGFPFFTRQRSCGPWAHHASVAKPHPQTPVHSQLPQQEAPIRPLPEGRAAPSSVLAADSERDELLSTRHLKLRPSTRRTAGRRSRTACRDRPACRRTLDVRGRIEPGPYRPLATDGACSTRCCTHSAMQPLPFKADESRIKLRVQLDGMTDEAWERRVPQHTRDIFIRAVFADRHLSPNRPTAHVPIDCIALWQDLTPDNADVYVLTHAWVHEKGKTQPVQARLHRGGACDESAGQGVDASAAPFSRRRTLPALTCQHYEIDCVGSGSGARITRGCVQLPRPSVGAIMHQRSHR